MGRAGPYCGLAAECFFFPCLLRLVLLFPVPAALGLLGLSRLLRNSLLWVAPLMAKLLFPWPQTKRGRPRKGKPPARQGKPPTQ